MKLGSSRKLMGSWGDRLFNKVRAFTARKTWVHNPLVKMLGPEGFPDGSDGNVSACNAGDLGSIPGSGRAPGEENEYSLQCSCLGNPMGAGAWWATIQCCRSRTRLNDFHFSLTELKGCFCLHRNSGKFWVSRFLASRKSVPVSSFNTPELHYFRALWQSP